MPKTGNSSQHESVTSKMNKYLDKELRIGDLKPHRIAGIQFTISIDNPSNDDFNGFVKELKQRGFKCRISDLKTTVYIIRNSLSNPEEDLRKVKSVIARNLKRGNCGSASLTHVERKEGYDFS